MTEMLHAEYKAMLEEFTRRAAQHGLKQESLQQVFGNYYKTVEKLGILRYFEPRKINAPPAYLPFKGVAAGLFGILDELMLKATLRAKPVPVDITAASVAYEVVRHKVPVYFVADDFIRAVAATDLPSDFTINDLHWPMPAMVLGLPVKFMRELTGRDIGYVNCANFPSNCVSTCPIKEYENSLLEILVPRAKVAWHWYSVADGNLESYVAAYHTGDRVDEALTKYAYVDYTDATQAKVSEDQVISLRLSALILKLLVILNTRPSLVVPGALERPMKIKHGKIKHGEIWSPNVIGAAYKVQRAEPVGTHASPRWHWRKGHLTHQRKGSPKSPDFVSVSDLPRRDDGQVDWDNISLETKEKFWACHERRWLEPTLVNFNE